MSNENNTVNRGSERKTLVLAVIAGVCGDALLSWVTMSEVGFSIFPLIALVLAVQALYQEYLTNPVSEDIPLVGLACFFVGAFGHSAFVKAQYPDAGSNFFAIIVAMLLLAWVGKKLGFIGKTA
ncbi:YijD family membrane protein [Vibrio gigantis]|uniref:YijD family membrane protein n=1 Tax=Vibrio gigantis TaxID=296199 RepID=A0A5M9N331_9VIBR|nr:MULTISPECIES: YijD family membrane protein [Vibrio]KAA8665333.1 YijD family membrane protein [Vibrio gigantis]MCG9555237.1 YijD family membrane protein [Vibrio sp. Isolate32]MCG9599997.1 YijD family membrane protein [Vibrio sp. Isolate31]ULN64134.1 YijD family membrane protein [Vibrio gigantis]